MSEMRGGLKLVTTNIYNFTKIKIKSFECPKSIRNYEKNNAWNIRRLVDESFVPSTHKPALYIEDCQIFSVIEMFLHCTHCTG